MTKIQLKDSKRIGRVMLILSVSCDWAVFTAMQTKIPHRSKEKKLEV